MLRSKHNAPKQPIATELRRIEDEVYAIKDEITYQKNRETTFRETNGLFLCRSLCFFSFLSTTPCCLLVPTETINARCAWLPIIAILAMGASTAAQIYYLRSFFQKKKLI